MGSAFRYASNVDERADAGAANQRRQVNLAGGPVSERE
jgi:hypothetical protein